MRSPVTGKEEMDGLRQAKFLKMMGQFIAGQCAKTVAE
jgi:hypothetical protein